MGSSDSVERLESATVRSSATTAVASTATTDNVISTTTRAKRFIRDPFRVRSGELGIPGGLGGTLAFEEDVEVARRDAHEAGEQEHIEGRPQLRPRMRF